MDFPLLICFSRFGLAGSRARGLSSWHYTGLTAPWHVESSRNSDWAPVLARWTLSTRPPGKNILWFLSVSRLSSLGSWESLKLIYQHHSESAFSPELKRQRWIWLGPGLNIRAGVLGRVERCSCQDWCSEGICRLTGLMLCSVIIQQLCFCLSRWCL